MIRLGLRCAPGGGPPDLAWLADVTGSLHVLCEFLLRAEITADVRRDRAPAEADLATIVDGRATELGGPLVEVDTGSMLVVELAVPMVDSTIPVQALAALAMLVRAGPDGAAWPGHLRQAWHAADAEPVRTAYARLRDRSTVEIVGSPGGSGGPAGGGNPMAPGVRRAPPLGAGR